LHHSCHFRLWAPCWAVSCLLAIPRLVKKNEGNTPGGFTLVWGKAFALFSLQKQKHLLEQQKTMINGTANQAYHGL